MRHPARRPSRLAAAVASVLALGACAPTGVNAIEVSDILLYGLGERHVVFYGDVAAGGRAARVGAQTLELAKPAEGARPDGFSVPSALVVGGQGSLRLQPTGALGERYGLATIPLTSDVSLTTRGSVDGVYYFDGQQWYTVSGPVDAGRKLRLRPQPRPGLRGIGQLSEAEADALATYLARRGPLAVALVPQAAVPDARLEVDPLPRDYRRTALIVQAGVPTDLLGGLTAPARQDARFRVLEQGANSAWSQSAAHVRLDASSSALAATWAIVGGNQVPRPAPPDVDFSRSRVVTVFLGQRPTGGYGLTVGGARLEGDTLVVEVTTRQPGPNAITTQSLTSPFVSIVVDATGFVGVRVVERGTNRVLVQTDR